MSNIEKSTSFLVAGDVHGNFQLTLSIASLWQKDLGIEFEAILLVGDLGSFTSVYKLDRATRLHAEKNPMELEFPLQWMKSPPLDWIKAIFLPEDKGGLGIKRVVAIHGNHEDFDYLGNKIAKFKRDFDNKQDRIISVDQLPSIDPNGYIKYLPSGWVAEFRSGVTVAGIGGIESTKRGRNQLYYISEEDIKFFLDTLIDVRDCQPVDILLTHHGPAAVQEERGSVLLNQLLEMESARYWFHGHAVKNPDITPYGKTIVVPLHDANFTHSDIPDPEAWGILMLGEEEKVEKGIPGSYQLLHKSKWIQRKLDGNKIFISPLLRKFV